MGRRFVLLPLLGLLAFGYAAKCPKQRTSPGREILCYTSTNKVETLQDSICRCTTLVHQGYDLQDLSTSGVEEFQKSLKELNPVLQFVLSINDKRGSLKTSGRARQESAARIVRILNEVDGIELNVTAGTKERLVHFMQGLKTEMVRKSKEKRILLVLPTKPQDLAKQFDIKGLSKYVDLFTIPTHYLIDDDEAYKTFHPSRLMGLFDMLNTDSLVDLVTGLGASKRKIVVSLPASAYKFTLENREETTPRAQTKEIQPVPISRLELCEAMEKGEWIVERDEDLTAPYAFKDDTWIAFEDKISAGIKGKYVLLRDLAGLGIHNVERDSKTKCGMSLTEDIYHSFTDNKRKTREAVLTSLQEDMQQRENSYPNQVKSSEFRIVRVVDTDGHVHANRENMQTEFSCTRQGYFVHPKSCNRFYRCVKFNQGVEDYSVFEFDCPAGLVFDEHTEVCVWPGSMEGSACPGSSEIAPSKGPKFTCPDKPGYYVDPQNCRFFYACYDLGEQELTAYEFTCPYGLVFDEKKLICEWPYLVPSCGGGTYQRNDYGGHAGETSGQGGNAGHGNGDTTVYTGHGGSGGHNGGSGGEYGGSSDGGEHGGSSSGGYDESGHGGQGSGHGGYSDSGQTTVHSGYGGGIKNGGSSGGGYDSEHTTGHGGGVTHGGSSGEHGNSHTTGHSGYDGDVGHGGSSGGGYDSGHTTGYGGGVTHGGSSGGGYDSGHATGHGGSVTHSGSSGEHGNSHTTGHSGYGGDVGHGGSSGGGYDSGHTTGYGGGVTHGGSSGGGYDIGHTTGHGGSVTHGGSSGGEHGNSQMTGHSGYGGDVGHGGSSGGGYDSGHTTAHSGYGGGVTHGGSSGGEHGNSHTTAHSGHGGVVIHGGFEGDQGNSHTTVHSGYGGGIKNGGSSAGGYDSGHTTVHSGYGGDVAHGGSSGGGYDSGHTTIHSGYGGDVGHGGSSGSGYDSGHTTAHSGYGGGVITGGSGGDENSHTTIHSGYGGGVKTDESEGNYGGGHTAVTIGHGGDVTHGGSSGGGYDSGQTTVHSGYGGGVTHGGSSGGGYDSGHTTVHSGYGGGVKTGESEGNYGGGHTAVTIGHGGAVTHGGSAAGGYDSGHTTVHSGYGGGVTHGGSSGGGYDSGHTTAHSGYGGGVKTGGSGGDDENSHTTIHSGFGGGIKTGESEGNYGGGHTAVTIGHGGGVTHGGSSGGGYDSGQTIVHSGYGGGVTHGGSSGGGYDSRHTTAHSGYGGGVITGGSGGDDENSHTTIHSEGGYGGGVKTGESEGNYGGGHTAVTIGHGGGVTHGGSAAGGYDSGHTTVHSGYNGGIAHGGSSAGGYDSGHTTVNSGYAGGVAHGGSSEDGATIIHSGYEGGGGHGGSSAGGYDSGLSTVHSGYGGSAAHGESEGNYGGGHTSVTSGHGGGAIDDGSEGGYVGGHTTVHLGHGSGVTHAGSSGGYDNGRTTVHQGYGDAGTHGGSSGIGHTASSQDEYEGSSGSVKGGYTTAHGSHTGFSQSPGVGIFTGPVHSSSTTGGAYSGESHANGYSGHSGTTGGISVTKDSFDHGYQTDSGNSAYTNHEAGAHAGINSGGYDGYTPIIQSGGQAGSTATHGIHHGTSIGGSLNSGNAGSTTYHGNFGTIGSGEYADDSGHTGSNSGVSAEGVKGSYNEHSSLGGSQAVSSSGSTTYHGNFGPGGYAVGGSSGSITGGSATQGVIGTADSTSGTVYSHGDVSGTILTGTNEQGKVLSGSTQPGYIQTHSGAPGYVVSNGVKTIYDDYNSKGTFDQGIGGHGVIVTGPQAHGAVLTGHSSPGTYVVGQTAPGVIHGGAVTPGISIGGSSGGQYYTGGSGGSIYSGATGSVTSGQESYNGGTKKSNLPKNPFIDMDEDMGYKTNEYHDNGGRGTIRYNNGEITHKYTEDDIKEHHTQFGTLPTFDAGSYETMPGSFTKTGPTKTGITTAQLGGSASYVAGTSKPRPFSSAQNIGANAFSSNSDHSDTSSKIKDDRTFVSSTNSPGLGYTSERPDYESGSVDISKINLSSMESKSGESSSGYSYTKPAIQLNTFGVRGSTKAPSAPIKQENQVYSTSPAPFLDVHVYNNPSIVTSAPVTAAPVVVNTYTYSKPSSGQYHETVYQAANLPSSSPGILATGIYSRPSLDTDRRQFPYLPSTVSPIAFTTGPLENFKTTVFEAARIPGSISTVQPVIDTGYKTVVSPTQYPIKVNSNSFGYNQNTNYRTDALSTKDNSALDIDVTFQQPHVSTHGKYSTVDNVAPAILVESGYGKSRKPFVTQSVTYEQPTIEEQTKYGSTGSSDYSETNDYSDYNSQQIGGSFGQKISQVSVTPTKIYNIPTYSPKIYNVPTSTIPTIGVTYRQPFQVVTSRPTARVPTDGYSYSKPLVKFPSTTSPSITYKNPNIDEYESQMTKTGGSPTNLMIPRKEVEKLITNYDRGSAKFTPSGYDTYNGDRREETTLNIDGYNRQKSYSSSSKNDGQSYASGKISAADRSGTHGRISSTTPSYELNTNTRQYGNRFSTSGSQDYESSNVNLDSSTKIGIGSSTTRLPVYKSSSAPSGQSSPSRRPSYSLTTPTVTTYSGGYSRGPSTSSYEVSTAKSAAKQMGRGKVIVKFSDLHPLLLGKLGAECTCKADPFANFRDGNKPLRINSSKGRVDLRNYDESEVYVDLESSKENGDYDSAEYITNSDDSGANYDDGKYETPVVAHFDNVTPATKGAANKSRKPSSTYLPISSSTYLPPVSSTKRPSSSTYLPPSSTYLPADSRDNVNAASYSNDGVSISTSFVSARGGGFRAGKNLRASGQTSSNGLAGQGATFDRYGPGGLRGVDETLQGTGDCAKPGLFRHPNYCNKFYACHWDEWKKKFTLHVLNCPVHLTFDSGASACNWPSKGPACQDDNLLV